MRWIAVISTVVALWTSVANAAVGDYRFSLRIFGHKVEVLAGANDKYDLKVDDKLIHSNYLLNVDQVGFGVNYGYVIGTSGPGGNACEGGQWLLYFPKNAPVRFDGPIEGCDASRVVVETRDGLIFDEPAGPLGPGERISWTPDKGFGLPASIAYAPEKGRGWDQLTEGTFQSPDELFSFTDLVPEIEQMLGPDKAEFQGLLQGVGQVTVDKEKARVIGSVCIAHMCPSGGSLFILDIAARNIYLAWKPMDNQIKVRPAVKVWPTSFRKQLKEWAANFSP